MRVLAIETATPRGGVAVVGPQGTLSELSAHVPGGHLEWLIPAIDQLLDAAGLRRDDIDGLAVSIGPGGFSGLRIGVATATAWAHSMDRPLVAVSTLEAIAAGVTGKGLVLAAVDARRGEVAAALFRLDESAERRTPDLLVTPEALRDALGPIAEPVTLAGDALDLSAPVLLDALAPWAAAAPPEQWWPRASAVGRLGRLRLLRGESDDPIGLVPVYIRRPDAREFRC
ncbi:MAG: tRNA (adenosine(37)-N6)-threonylcarbamoyltransferase complex dimerization subunit type 1 TsaB [Armatimonadota bacterium]